MVNRIGFLCVLLVSCVSTDRSHPTVIDDVSVVDVRRGTIMGHQTITIREGPITNVEPAGAPLPENARARFVKNGVTTVRNLGSGLENVASWRRDIERGVLIGPQIVTAGSILESRTFVEHVARVHELLKRKGVAPAPLEIERATRPIPVGTPDDARRAVADLSRRGGQWIKFRSVESRETFLAIAATAKSVGL